MDETQKALGDLRRADQAKALLDNPLYQEAVTAMKLAMSAEFEDSKLADADVRHELWQRMQLMKQFQGKFEHIVKTGNKATQTLSLLEKGKKLLNR
jgi:hypothetical protein